MIRIRYKYNGFQINIHRYKIVHVPQINADGVYLKLAKYIYVVLNMLFIYGPIFKEKSFF